LRLRSFRGKRKPKEKRVSISERDLIRQTERARDELLRSFRIALKKGGRDMVSVARTTHRFRSLTGTVDRSIESIVDDKQLTMTFQINPDNVMLPNGYNRGAILNSGTLGNYKRGKIDPDWGSTAGGPAGTGIPHDDFMGRAWERVLPKMDAELETIFRRLK
jgi:hypothetical protein